MVASRHLKAVQCPIIHEGIRLWMYGKQLEMVGSFKFLGVTLDARLTFAVHIKKIEGYSYRYY